MRGSVLGLVLPLLHARAEYVWPSKHDYLEDLLVLQNGYIRQGFVDGVNPCDRTTANDGRQIAAEWVRTAFHDMATHDAATGTGGLDASIQFETERGENLGDAFNGTFGFTNNYFSSRASAADLVALSTILAVGNCGGPHIPFRVGRIDATEAGPSGVPEPQQDIDTHISQFAKAGFNTEDMIAMVACGHTLGGVHGKNFPEITLNSSDVNVEHFEHDSSFSNFDNTVVTEYLEDDTANLLVVGTNDTLNSDKRVFAADGNVTMQALSDPATFQSRCADILGRMIDTVPSSVTLSEPLEPFPFKPYITSFSLANATHITFTGRIRLKTTNEDYNNEVVRLQYTPRNEPLANATLNTTISTRAATFKLGTSNGIFGELFRWHEFSVSLPVDTSIKSFTASVTNTVTGKVTLYDNGGTGSYPLDDTVLYQDVQSCHADGVLTISAAVRKDVIDAGTPVKLEIARKVARQGSRVPAFQHEEWDGVVGAELADWVLVDIKGDLDFQFTHFDIVAGDSRVEFVNVNPLSQRDCVPL